MQGLVHDFLCQKNGGKKIVYKDGNAAKGCGNLRASAKSYNVEMVEYDDINRV